MSLMIPLLQKTPSQRQPFAASSGRQLGGKFVQFEAASERNAISRVVSPVTRVTGVIVRKRQKTNVNCFKRGSKPRALIDIDRVMIEHFLLRSLCTLIRN